MRRDQPAPTVTTTDKKSRLSFALIVALVILCHPVSSCFILFSFVPTRFATPSLGAQTGPRDTVPLPEHPRPDFERAEWVNLNGRWEFAFDRANDGERAGWAGGSLPAPREILVP